MKIGLIPVNVGVKSAEQMVGLAQYAESLGVESLWTFEHAMVPVDYTSPKSSAMKTDWRELRMSFESRM